MSRLLLRPTPADVTIDSIRVLLLYIQWMPCSQEDDDDSFLHGSKPGFTKSRYNDISAWAVLGIAARYSVFLGLERAATSPFQRVPLSITEDDMSRMRVWQNLLSCDCVFMLCSGLPASLNPASATQVAQPFVSHPSAQQPGDLRVTALVELVDTTYRARRNCGDFSGRQLDALSLRKANTEFDDWE